MHRPENPAPITATSRSALGGLKGAFMADNMSVQRAVCKLAVAAAFVAFVVPATAQPGLDIETVVVTASPPEPVGQGAFSSVTLDQNALTESNQLDASLEQVSGLSLFRRSTSLNANPTTQGISLRGIAPSGAGRALVLLDGVPVNDPFGGWVIWTQLPSEDVGGAEVIRGAG